MTCSRALFLIVLAVLSVASSAMAANFVSTDPQVAQIAERARDRSARFWTGDRLPGDWWRPCPIEVYLATCSPAGKTSFQIQDGEVFGWTMTVSGPRQRILNDIIPHEVDHMVRATLIRRPIERWLDEGSAAIFESSETRADLRRIAATVDAARITTQWLSSRSYPSSIHQLQEFYAISFTLVEMLIADYGAQTVFKLQLQPGPIEYRLSQHCGLTVPQLRARWNEWRHNEWRNDEWRQAERRPNPITDSVPVTKQHVSDHPTELPTLRVWTASWCPQCVNFWQAYKQDQAFRERLAALVRIIVVDYDQHSDLARERQITALPAFEIGNRRVQGYTDTETLMVKLKSLFATMSEDGRSDPAEVGRPQPSESVRPPESTASPSIRPPTASQPLKTFPPGTTPADRAASPEAAGDSQVPVSKPQNPQQPPVAPRLQAAKAKQPNDTDDAQPAEGEARDVASIRQRPRVDSDVVRPKTSDTVPTGSKRWRWVRQKIPWGLTLLQWSGLLGGTLATGGVVGVAVAVGSGLVRSAMDRRRSGTVETSSTSCVPSERGSVTTRQPFPRHLDEARQLLELRQTEGRVAALDALRGMFFDDEFQKVSGSAEPQVKATLNELRAAIDARVDEVAPLSTRV